MLTVAKFRHIATYKTWEANVDGYSGNYAIGFRLTLSTGRLAGVAEDVKTRKRELRINSCASILS